MAGFEGVIYVRFVVTETGEVDDIEIVGGFPPGAFNEVVVDALEGWRYDPATQDGVPVRRSGVEQRFDYRMQR